MGAPWYNRVAVPIGLFLLFLTGVGPLLPWRATSIRAIKRNFIVPVIALWVTVIVALAAGVNPLKDNQFDSGNFYALIAFALSAAVLAAIISEFVRGARCDLHGRPARISSPRHIFSRAAIRAVTAAT